MKIAKLSGRWTTAADYLVASPRDQVRRKGSDVQRATRYFFHLREAGRLVPDEDGILLRGIEEVRREARRGAKWMIAAAAETNGSSPPKSKIEVRDEAGNMVYELHL